MIVSILVAVVIFVLVIWAIGFLPLPSSPPLKTILYIIAIAALILYLVRFV